MSGKVILRFCGNPANHDQHDYESIIFGVYRGFHCDGVSREEVEPEVIAKYDPREEKEDGTVYSKVTILIEDAKGNVTIIHAPKSDMIQLDVERQTYVAIDVVTKDFVPEIDKAIFRFVPRADGDNPAFTVERKDPNGEPR